MMRSLFSGVAGLKTHQTKMDVIGNNIANVNTTAYKSQSITFSDLLYQTTQSASGANSTTGQGGTNARQIGLGSKTGAISTSISTQGSAQSTSNPFDIMITGDNFFVVSNGSENFFTRDGSFCVDGVGNLVMSSTGYTVMGWKADSDGNIIQDKVSAMKIMSAEYMTYPPEATSKAYVSGIVDKNDTNVNSTTGKVMSLSFYDKLGYQYNARFTIHNVDGDNGQFYVQLDGIYDSNGDKVTDAGEKFGSTITADVKSSFSSSKIESAYEVGSYTKTNTDGSTSTVYGIFTKGTTTYSDTNDLAATATSDDLKNTYFKGVGDTLTGGQTMGWDSASGTPYIITPQTVTNGQYLTFDSAKGTFDGIGDTTSVTADNSSTTLTFSGTNFGSITIDWSQITMYNNSGTSTVSATSGDTDGLGTGRKLGEMSGVSIAKDGIITATYDNGQNRILGQLSTASFANAAGLEKAGDNLYSATMNSGEFDGIGTDITSGGGYMTTGVLEMSNVDLAQQFTDMITTQRGFQANSRIITVSDTLLEELTNLKR